MITADIDNRLLNTAKAVYMEGKSFPEVYRFLIQHIDSEKAIHTLYELKKIVENNKVIAQ